MSSEIDKTKNSDRIYVLPTQRYSLLTKLKVCVLWIENIEVKFPIYKI